MKAFAPIAFAALFMLGLPESVLAEEGIEVVSAPPAQSAQAQNQGDEPRAIGDRRVRLVLFGRFGIAGKYELKADGVRDVSLKPDPTFGMTARVEKPVSKFFALGGLISWYEFGPTFERNFNGPRDFAMDFSLHLKPRFPFALGRHEGEVYVVAHFGGTHVTVNNELIVGSGRGFNTGGGLGFQALLAPHVGLVAEGGYGFTWARVANKTVTLTLGQATVYFGLVIAFGSSN
jgi:hypothetical protein